MPPELEVVLVPVVDVVLVAVDPPGPVVEVVPVVPVVPVAPAPDEDVLVPPEPWVDELPLPPHAALSESAARPARPSRRNDRCFITTSGARA
jgi:hypothetical protein